MITTHGLTHVALAVRDPDGYEVEIWYEPPTPNDPPGPAAAETSPQGRLTFVAIAVCRACRCV